LHSQLLFGEKILHQIV